MKYNFLSFILIIFLSDLIANPPKKDKVPDIKMRMLNGEYSQLYDYIGEGPLLIDFWTTWCPNCDQQMGYINKITNHYEKAGLKVLAININNPKIVNKVKPYAQKRNFSFDVAIDPESKIADALDIQGIPTTIFIDKDGKIWDRHVGFSPGMEKDYVSSLVTYFEKNNIDHDPISLEETIKLNENQNVNIEF